MKDIIIVAISSGLVLSVFTYLTTRKYSERRFSTELEKLKQEVEASRTENDGKKTANFDEIIKAYQDVIKDCNERYNDLSDKYDKMQREIIDLKEKNSSEILKLSQENFDLRKQIQALENR